MFILLQIRCFMIDTTDIRNHKIIKYYQELIQIENEKDPERAKYLGKQYYYNKIAERFCLNPKYVQIIIIKMFRCSDSSHNLNY